MDANPSLAEMLRHSSADPFWIVALVGALTMYGLAYRRARSFPPRRQQPRSRGAAFLAGCLVLGLAVFSPIGSYGNEILWIDFLGFLLITMIAAPLIVLGAPLTLAFRVTGNTGRRRLRAVYRSWPVEKLTFPITAWLLFAAVTYIWQFSNLTDVAAQNWLVRDSQQFTLLLVAFIFWTPALCADPVRWRMPYPLRALYVFVEMTHKGLFGGMFLATNHTFHSGFAARLPAWANLSPITDQRVAILVLWIGGNMVFVVALIFLLIGWLRYERRNAHRIDVRLALQREERRARKAALEKVFARGV